MLSLLLLVLATIVASTVAFTPILPHRHATRFHMSSAETSSTDVAATNDAKESLEDDEVLGPEYKAALAQVKGALSQVIKDEKQLGPLIHFSTEYLTANQDALKAGNEDGAAALAAERMLNGIKLGMTHGMGENKYMFGPSHKALRGKDPEAEDGNEYDYYAFGCDFFGPCMDPERSVVLGKDNLDKAMEQLANGENVVFFANHQSEADPQVVSVCFEKVGYGEKAAELTYVAGHKVTTDPLAVPFSMGRNLICIHSKKHIDSEPEKKPLKQRQNLAAMGAMLGTLKEGGASIWVAPSGGRDRRNVETGEVPLAPFDPKTVAMFKTLATKSKVKTHFYPLAMVTYDLCPPPDYVEAGVGEQRNVRFVPVGIACGPEVVEDETTANDRDAFCEVAMATCQADYDRLLEVMKV